MFTSLAARRGLAGWVSAGVVLCASPTHAQTPPCGRHDVVLDQLAKQHGEAVTLQALQSDGHLLELTTSADGATWTALVTAASGVACVVAAGHHLVRLPPPPAGDGS